MMSASQLEALAVMAQVMVALQLGACWDKQMLVAAASCCTGGTEHAQQILLCPVPIQHASIP
jgi:hypothetical protein